MSLQTIRRGAGMTYAVIALAVVVFQFGLALGAPWGAYAMGGSFPGRYPPAMRAAAVAQALAQALLAAVVLSRAGVAFLKWSRVSRVLIWVVVAVGAIGLTLNLITPSVGERALWAPVAFLLLASSSAVAAESRRRP